MPAVCKSIARTRSRYNFPRHSNPSLSRSVGSTTNCRKARLTPSTTSLSRPTWWYSHWYGLMHCVPVRAALQQEFLWGWNGENINYGKLSFGLFVAGEIEIIMGGNMNDNDAHRRLQILKTTAYRAQYVDWLQLLHLHAAVMRKIESGLATWNTNFEQVERMVLENQEKVDWSARLGQYICGQQGGWQKHYLVVQGLPVRHLSTICTTQQKHQKEGGNSATHMRQVPPKGGCWA